MRIGNLEIKKTAVLAPMAGVTDKAFREICSRYGASYSVSEMVSAKALTMGDKKSRELMERPVGDKPCGIQIFGCDPTILSEATKIVLEFKPDVIDINMGCPAPKIVKNGCGSSLMKNPELIEKCVSAVKKTSSVPVSVKMRTGFDKENINVLDCARAAECGGADFLTIHGKTREQMYAPPTNIELIADVKRTVNIPVIGNGDIFSLDDAKYMYENTGCDLIMVGRGSLGNPWIFKKIDEYFSKGIISEEPTAEERMSQMLFHVELLCKYKGEKRGILEARKHSMWYTKGLRGSASYRRNMSELNSIDELRKIAAEIVAEN